MTGFHEVLFPLGLSKGSTVALEHRVKIITMNQGLERRVSPWSKGRRRYEVSQGVLNLSDIETLMDFFQARHGPLFGFRFRDPFHDRSSVIGEAPGPFDQEIGTGDGVALSFALTKTQGDLTRKITRPVADSLRLSVAGQEISDGFALEPSTGLVSFEQAPPHGALIRAGFFFDTPVRFENETLEISLEAFAAGRLRPISLIEIL